MNEKIRAMLDRYREYKKIGETIPARTDQEKLMARNKMMLEALSRYRGNEK